MSTTRLSSKERRAAIIEAAMRLFAERGFRGTTTRELASSIGVSEPILYQHFKTKLDIYHAILETMAEQHHPRFPDLEALYGLEDDRALLEQLANAVVNWHRDNPNFVRLLMMGALEGNEFNELFFERYARAFSEQLQKYFSDRAARGIFRPIEPVMASRAFLWAIAQYSLEVTLFCNKHCGPGYRLIPQDEAITGLVDIFLKGLQA